MKKTTTVHLSGVLFNIEEDAYEKLSQYTKSIETHFASHPGRKEIIEDIETRIAEILSEKLNAHKQVITTEDVNEVISRMGKAEQFEESVEEQNNQYQNVKTKKRFYRNPEDKILGGVCGGIAAYFDIDPLWIRLTWAILFFVYGTGILFYILLWIIIPEAKTTSQKLEMRGEKINISNISKDISQDISKTAKKSSRQLSKLSENKIIAFIQNIFQYILSFIHGTGKTIIKFLAVVLILLLGLIFTVFAVGIFEYNFVAINTKSFVINFSPSDFFNNPFESFLFSLSLLLFIEIPILLFIVGLIKFVFNIKKQIRYAGVIALFLWLTGLGLLIYFAINYAENFSEKSYQKSQIAQFIVPGKTIYLKMSEDDEYNIDEEVEITFTNNTPYSSDESTKNVGFPSVTIKRSKDDSLKITIIKTSMAENKRQARIYAKNISYEININDSLIEMSSKYDIPKEDKFHFQKVKIIIEIPQNRYVYLSENMKYYLAEAENNVDADETDMVGKKWLMGIDHLQCIEQCDKISNISRHHKKKRKSKKHQSEENEHEDDI